MAFLDDAYGMRWTGSIVALLIGKHLFFISYTDFGACTPPSAAEPISARCGKTIRTMVRRK